jgi:hypothetical protein
MEGGECFLETMPSASHVRVNRLKDSYTWNVEVAAESSSLDDLQAAREKAVAVSRELDADLRPISEQVEMPEQVEVPF